MSNTVTAILPTLYAALRTISRELVGFIPAVARDSRAERAAVGQTVSFHIVPTMTSANIEAANTLGPTASDTALTSDSMQISKSKGVSFHWTGEEQRGTGHSGMRPDVFQQQFEQAMRTLVNEVEADVAGLYLATSRGIGTAGTAPFSTNHDVTADLKKILDDNGCPQMNRSLVIDTSAGANLRKLTHLTKVNESGVDDTLRGGILLPLNGFGIRESAQIKSHTKGVGAADTTSGATNTKGKTTIATSTIAAGDYVAGDVIEIVDVTGRYVVTGMDADANTIAIAEPGLLEEAPTGKAITLAANYTANIAFHRNSLQLATRAPAMPEGGDAADDVIEIQDPVSGLAFQVAIYRQRRQIAYEVGLAWGVKGVQAAHAALLLG